LRKRNCAEHDCGGSQFQTDDSKFHFALPRPCFVVADEYIKLIEVEADLAR